MDGPVMIRFAIHEEAQGRTVRRHTAPDRASYRWCSARREPARETHTRASVGRLSATGGFRPGPPLAHAIVFFCSRGPGEQAHARAVDAAVHELMVARSSPSLCPSTPQIKAEAPSQQQEAQITHLRRHFPSRPTGHEEEEERRRKKKPTQTRPCRAFGQLPTGPAQIPGV